MNWSHGVERFALSECILFVLEEEWVAGWMSEVCPFLKDINSKDQDPPRSLVRSR